MCFREGFGPLLRESQFQGLGRRSSHLFSPSLQASGQAALLNPSSCYHLLCPSKTFSRTKLLHGTVFWVPPSHPIFTDFSLRPQLLLGSSSRWGGKPKFTHGAGTHTGVSRADPGVMHGHPGLYWLEPRGTATAPGVPTCLSPPSGVPRTLLFSLD